MFAPHLVQCMQALPGHSSLLRLAFRYSGEGLNSPLHHYLPHPLLSWICQPSHTTSLITVTSPNGPDTYVIVCGGQHDRANRRARQARDNSQRNSDPKRDCDPVRSRSTALTALVACSHVAKTTLHVPRIDSVRPPAVCWSTEVWE